MSKLPFRIFVRPLTFTSARSPPPRERSRLSPSRSLCSSRRRRSVSSASRPDRSLRLCSPLRGVRTRWTIGVLATVSFLLSCRVIVFVSSIRSLTQTRARSPAPRPCRSAGRARRVVRLPRDEQLDDRTDCPPQLGVSRFFFSVRKVAEGLTESLLFCALQPVLCLDSVVPRVCTYFSLSSVPIKTREKSLRRDCCVYGLNYGAVYRARRSLPREKAHEECHRFSSGSR